MPERFEAAAETAHDVFSRSALLRATWRRLSGPERDRVLEGLMATAAELRDGLGPNRRIALGPTVDDVHRQLRAPTSEVFLQPIVWLPTGEVVGLEALTRFPAWSPDQWFRRAWDAGIGLEFERLAVERAIPLLSSLPDDMYLALNVAPFTLISTELCELLGRVDASRIVLELTEHDPIAQYAPFRDQIARLRFTGARVAIDDVGAGHSSLQHIVQLAPDIIKIDRGLISGCGDEPTRCALIGCVAAFARRTGASVVAEGIETASEAAAVVSAGIAFGQGYFFGRPEREPILAPRKPVAVS
jgi:EAL domain-containing protein (putative c-di-GMP-specific phosphodiesterase class I)